MADSQLLTTMVNLARTHLGHTPLTAASEYPAAVEAYPYVRDKILTWARWRFATTRQTLVRLAEPPADGYPYQYALPTNPYPLRILEVGCGHHDYAREVYIHPKTPDHQQPVILTAATGVVLRYIARVSEAVWPPLVFDTCALWLAVTLAHDITGKATLRSQLFQELGAQLDRAILLEGHQDTPRQVHFNDTYLYAREMDVVPRVTP